jgi:uncharacterized membrane protein YidH (DUF202 family)
MKGAGTMSEKGKFRYNKVLCILDKVEFWARRAIWILVVVAFMMTTLATLGKLAIKVIYALVLIVFAVGTVKSGLGAQAAQAFGATSRVSHEMMNLVGGILIFGIAIMTLPLANMIIDTVTEKLFVDGFTVEINNPFAP